MPVFYYDEKIRECEKDLNFSQVINYLEELFKEKENVQILNSLIAYSWYFFVEGSFLLKDDNFNGENYLLKWDLYLEYGQKRYFKFPEFLYVAGYTLGLHWFFLYPKYNETTGLALMKRCYDLNTDINLQVLSNNFIKNSSQSKRNIILDNLKEISSKLFPSNSLIDQYFCSVLLK